MTARLRRGRTNTASKIQRRPEGRTDLPLSYGQEQLWFMDRFAPGQPTYNLPFVLRLSGPLDAGSLGRAISGLVARHEALRTRLVADADGRPAQVIDPPQLQPLELADLSGLEPDRRQARLREFIDIEALRPFDLPAGPLLRTWLLRLAADEHLLLVVVHHAVFDGWSIGVFVRELAALYRQAASGEPAGLAELPVQFADYALWERHRLQGSVLAELGAYWRGVMEGFDTVRFPTDRPRPVLENFDGGLIAHMTDLSLLDGLRDVARRAGTTLFVALMAGLQALLHRYTGQTDLVVGTVSANRSKAELSPLIGFLVNTLPIRADLSGDPPFTELLARVQEATLGAYGHQDLPFAKLVETLQVERDPSRGPVFQIALAYADRADSPVSAAGVEFVATDLVTGFDAAKFDLDIQAESRRDGLWFECSYKTALFDRATVRRLLGNLEVLLAGVAADPSARLSQLPVLTQDELHAELVEWNDTAAELDPACIHQGFEAQVIRTPDAVAAEFEDERISYAELNQQANQIARRLRDLGVGPETLVGVCMQTGLRRLAGLLGIWKAGGGYVPMDPALPAGRLSFTMTDTGMPMLLADEQSLARLPETGAAVLSLDADWPAISQLPGSNLADTGVSPANAAYVIYTSGSTGQPKGVVVEHRQAVNTLLAMNKCWGIGPSSAVLQFAAFTFDVSVTDMFMPLLAGARLVLAPADTLHSPPRLAALIRDAGITYVDLPPAVLSLLRDEQFPDLRVLMTGGEELPSEVARHWIRPGLRFVNGYGPTETAVTATCQELDASMSPPPIGLPLPNCQAYVLDPRLNPVPAGAVGELHIGGAGVARGYLSRPELTRERFIPDPFSADPQARLYKSGDLVRRVPGGALVFTGRADGQVKIRGLRIELGEIETALAAHPAIAQAAAAVVTDQAGEKQLAAYLRAEPGTQASPADLRAHLARTLPAYMIPTYLITVEELPLNSSRKIDRAALPAPDQLQAATEHAAPATFTESVLVDLYAAVLSREQVGAADSFFDIGGSSLQVMRLVDMISKQLGVDVGVSTIFLHPSPRQLAESIDAIRSGDRPLAGSGPLAELSSGVGQLPLFLIHAVGGTVFAYAQLASELAGTFRVYGLEAPGLTQPDATAESLDGLVSDYTERIRAAQPTGPYRLAGWSMGGVVAYEIARRLELAGQQVSLLVLLDAPFALPDTGVPAQGQLAGRFLADATHSLGWDQADTPDPDSSTVAEQLAWLAGRLGGGDGAADRDAVAAQLRRRFDIFQAHVRILAGYQPAGPAVGAPTLIVSADDSPNAPASSRWPGVLRGPVSTQRVPGDHYSFLRPPLVAEISTSILKWQAGSE
jgi:amino acid adenylation domain-containing protein